jgi:hypothetical protein
MRSVLEVKNGSNLGCGFRIRSETEIIRNRNSENEYRPKPRCAPSATRPRPSSSRGVYSFEKWYFRGGGRENQRIAELGLGYRS